jgi:hypothetical protein
VNDRRLRVAFAWRLRKRGDREVFLERRATGRSKRRKDVARREFFVRIELDIVERLRRCRAIRSDLDDLNLNGALARSAQSKAKRTSGGDLTIIVLTDDSELREKRWWICRKSKRCRRSSETYECKKRERANASTNSVHGADFLQPSDAKGI